MSNVDRGRLARANTSDVNLAKMMSDLNRVMRTSANTSVLTTFPRKGQKAQKQIQTLDGILSSEDNDVLPIQDHDKTPAMEYLSYFLNHPQLRMKIGEITWMEARCIYALEMDRPFSKAEKDALLDAF